MQVVLVQKNMWEQVNIEVEVNEGVTPEEALSKMLQKQIKDKMAKVWVEIILQVEEDQLELLEEEKNHHECWFKLRNTHRAKGFITELANVKGMVRVLKEVNVEVNETQKVLVLVMGLMDKYGMKILNEEMRHGGPDGASEPEMVTWDQEVPSQRSKAL
ncbi:uncharacterized protein LAESUDRAFT_761124 [Laetiporus sulphureus 93-53]|uniref:Uncharacterized protein n=1 Tax=Laetiporus sulphureus 93-53 TaxID=1314785 RepID=A0A165D6U1_9APHY|nr:uncharacterized protein LAESUDRAFT_761124 [Laetiporus sulphureus 93-53]KZT04260.1 hypothetical protein LAESUDRAFT_761124 [Laetiporus sulphureus 93-53]